MTRLDQLKKQIQTLYAMVRIQKGARLGLRALWLGMTGILVGWAVHALWGWLPNSYTWVLLGFGLALIPAVGVLIALLPLLADLSPPGSWIYAVDSRLGLRQQLSTAWELAQKNTGGPVVDLLAQDILALMPRARDRILDGGWYRKFDLAATAAATLFSCALLAALFLQPSKPPTAAAPTPIIPQTSQQQPLSPNPEQQPEAQGVQPGTPQNGQDGSLDGSAAPGDANQPGGDQPGNDPSAGDTSAGSAPENGTEASSDSGADPGAVADALRQLGSELSKQAGTYDLGQALENLDMNGAASALEDLKDQLKDLSPESRQNLSKALEDAAQNLDQANAPSLSEDMQGAAEALQSDEGSAAQSLGEVAQDLRQMDGSMQAFKSNGAGPDSGESARSGQSAPVDRLPNENGAMEIPQENPNNSGLLSPASPDQPGEGTASGSLDANRPQPSPAGQSPLLPNSFLWKWRDVVSQYFQH